ncbi:MAG: cyclic nucleotide-binding domain-containing protein [Bdellovibrionia bacterium]
MNAPAEISEFSLLKKIKLLQSLNQNNLERLISLGQHLRVESHTNIIIEGELSWGLYLLLEGTAGIFKTNKLTGDHYDLAQLKGGSFFGELSLLDENPRTATVRAITPCTLFYVSKKKFMELLESDPTMKLEFYQNAIQTLATRLRDLDDNYVISQFQLWKSILRKETGKS